MENFVRNHLEPFSTEVSSSVSDKFELARLSQRVEHFGLKIENGISLDTRKDSRVGLTCYKICQKLF